MILLAKVLVWCALVVSLAFAAWAIITALRCTLWYIRRK